MTRQDEHGFSLLELLVAITIFVALAGLMTLWGVQRMITAPTGTKCARDLEAMRSAAYTWRDEYAMEDFSMVTLDVLSSDGVRLLSPRITDATANPWAGTYRMVVDPDNANRFRIYIEHPADPQDIIDDVEKYVRGTYHASGVDGLEAWFSF